METLKGAMCPGLDEDLVRDLRAADVKTVEDLVSCNIEELAQKCSVSYKALFAIRRVLLAQHTAFPVSGADLYEELLSTTAILSTGHPSLDRVLDSGLFTGEITELCGAPGSGKTQVSLHLKQRVVYIDTTGGFSSTRLLSMLQTETANTEEQTDSLQRIHVIKVFDVLSLLDCLRDLHTHTLQQMSMGSGSVKAVMVDSVSAVICPLLGTKTNEGLSLMVQMAALLKTLAKDWNVAVLVTNHVTRGAGGEPMAALGASWSHIPRTRILLEPFHSNANVSVTDPAHLSPLRYTTLIKSSRQACHTREELDLTWWSRSEAKPSGKRKRDQTDS